MPSIDFDDMDSGQSDIRNKIMAQVFKRLGIIEQWGNGLILIAEELIVYLEVELSWKEPGIAFRVTFTNKYYLQKQELQNDQKDEWSTIGTKRGLSWYQVTTILEVCRNAQSIQNIVDAILWKDRTKFRNKFTIRFWNWNSSKCRSLTNQKVQTKNI